jgi:hypothetical protein
MATHWLPFQAQPKSVGQLPPKMGDAPVLWSEGNAIEPTAFIGVQD